MAETRVGWGIPHPTEAWVCGSGYSGVLSATATEDGGVCATAPTVGGTGGDCAALLQAEGYSYLQLSAAVRSDCSAGVHTQPLPGYPLEGFIHHRQYHQAHGHHHFGVDASAWDYR